jgi:uncharacterized damage-inducible protein DinB
MPVRRLPGTHGKRPWGFSRRALQWANFPELDRDRHIREANLAAREAGLPRTLISEDLRTGLRASRERLFAALGGLTEEQFRFAPDAASWNIAAHLGHLLRIERMFAARGALALRETEPSCPSTSVANDDDPALAQHLAVPQMVHGLQASRRDIEGLLDAGDHALDRAIIHDRIGRMTVKQIVKKMMDHELEHAESIEVLARQARSARRVTIPLTPRS